MFRRIESLLTLLFACLIGLSPIQAAWSGAFFVDHSATIESGVSHHPMMASAAGGRVSGHATHACGGCDMLDCCGGGCQFGHCAVCVVSALPMQLPLPEHHAGGVYFDGFSFSLPRRAPSPFFRPPRG